MASLNIHNHLMNVENEGMNVTGQQDVTPEGLNNIPSTASFQPHSCVFRLSLLNVSIYPICHPHNGAQLQTQAKVKQFPKKWWKRKPLKMLFVYEAGFRSCYIIFMLFTSLYTGVRKMKLQANRNRLF